MDTVLFYIYLLDFLKPREPEFRNIPRMKLEQGWSNCTEISLDRTEEFLRLLYDCFHSPEKVDKNIREKTLEKLFDALEIDLRGRNPSVYSDYLDSFKRLLV